MKTKEIIQLVVALIVFVIAGYMIYLQVKPRSAQKAVPTVEVITPIAADYNEAALDKLSDTTKSKNFYSEPNLNDGIGNSQPFGPLR